MDKKISELDEITSLEDSDLLVVAKDIGGSTYENRKIQSSNINPSGVFRYGNQTIDGIKTFTSFPVSPSGYPADDFQMANKKYVDDNTGGVSADGVAGIIFSIS